MFHELQKLMWLNTPKGEATVLGFFDYGPESELYWVCVQQTGEIWTWPNDKVRAVKNVSLGRVPMAPGYYTKVDKGKPEEAHKPFTPEHYPKAYGLELSQSSYMGVSFGEDNQD